MKISGPVLLAVLVMAGVRPAKPQSGTNEPSGTAAPSSGGLKRSADRVGAVGTVTSVQGVAMGFTFGPVASAIPPKPHAPFSAVMVEQADQMLNDGTNISRDSREVVARDSSGRVYRAREVHVRGRAEGEGERLVLFTIADPVRHVFYHCSPVPKICGQLQYGLPPNPSRYPLVPKKMPGTTVEELGSSTISGMEVEGKRLTRVIAEGAVGNDRPFSIVEETWHSRELGVDVQAKRTDPRMGTRTSTLTDVSLGEPDPKYFQIPEGYRVEVRKGMTGGLAPLRSVADPVSMNPAEALPPR